MHKVLISNIMMLNEKERFDRKIRDIGCIPIWADVKQFLSEKECLGLVGDIDGWLAGDDQITELVLSKAAPKLKIISKWGTGIDSIDLPAAKSLGVKVENSPGAFANAVSEVAIHYMISLSRKLITIHNDIRSGGWPKIQGKELNGSHLGLVGFGAIGKQIAKVSHSLGMEISFYDPFVQGDIINDQMHAKSMQLNDIAKKSDVVCLACNYSQENHHLINHSFFSDMKSDAYLINVARGPIVNEAALIDALQKQKIAGAGLDVFEQEPISHENPLLKMSNVILGSHNANNGISAVEYVHENTLNNLVAALA